MLGLFVGGEAQGRKKQALEADALRVEMIEHSSTVWKGAYRTEISLEQAFGTAVRPENSEPSEQYMAAFINNPEPVLSWALKAAGHSNGDRQHSRPGPSDRNPGNPLSQQAYRVRVATSPELLRNGKADVWDSGIIHSEAQSCRLRSEKGLRESTIYYWNVEIWSSASPQKRICSASSKSRISPASSFITAAQFSDGISRYPLEKHDETLVPGPDGRLDFGRDAFSQFTLNFRNKGTDSIVVHIGEKAESEKAESRKLSRKAEASIRYTKYAIAQNGLSSITPEIRKDKRNTDPSANVSGVKPVLMPDYIGEVYPFRYMELERTDGTPLDNDVISSVTRHRVTWPIDKEASSFHCSDSVLNAVWELCRYTVEATSFCGTYVDGDRERIPYEADAIINQLSHYAIDDEYTMARHSVRHLIYNPTWPTEWILQCLIMAWNDYLYTGNTGLISVCYEDLKAKTLMGLREDNGLISTRLGKCNEDFFRSIHYKGKYIKDIVDWPVCEEDGFIFSDFNAVVNAYHYKALRIMADIADVLGRKADKAQFAQMAETTRMAFNELFYDEATGLYRDGVGVDHSSQHSNFFALCFGLVPAERAHTVVDFVKGKGMACSVYGAQFLLDALYDYGEAEHALSLMNSPSVRSWYNMMRIGSTITTEAWDPVFKPNLDWNHPWGAAPANVISRKLMGVEPLEGGFSKVRIKPQTAGLSFAEIVVPTIRGAIRVCIASTVGSTGEKSHDSPDVSTGEKTLSVEIPYGMDAEIWLPQTDGSWKTVNVGAGRHRFSIFK